MHGIVAYNRTLQRPAKRIRLSQWTSGLYRSVSTRVLSPERNGFRCRHFWKSISQRATANLVAMWLYYPACLFAKTTATIYLQAHQSNQRQRCDDLHLPLFHQRVQPWCYNIKKANGNTLNAKLMEQLADLSKNPSDIFRQLGQGK